MNEREDIIKHLNELRDAIQDGSMENATGAELIEYLMEVHKLESLLMTAIDDLSNENI